MFEPTASSPYGNLGRYLLPLAPVLLLLSACASDIPAPAPRYDSLEKVSAATGCVKVLDIAEVPLNGVVSQNICTQDKGDAFTILRYVDASARDRLVSAGEQENGYSYLVLNDVWAVQGLGDDIVALRNKLGDGELRTPDEAATASPDPTATPSVDCTTADQQTWTKYCSGEEGNSPNATAIPLGKTATDNGEQVRIDKVYCNDRAQRVLRKVKSNPRYGSEKYDPNYNLPPYIDVKASKSEEFCVIAVEWKNVGKKPQTSSSFGSLVTSNGTEYNENEYGGSLTNASNADPSFSAGAEFNPGKGYRMVLSYTVPKGSRAVSVNWGSNDYTQAAKYTLKLS
jgi:hypothetical protein